MCAGTPYGTGAPTIEVRVHRSFRLLVRESCQSEEFFSGDDEDQPIASMQLPGYGTE